MKKIILLSFIFFASFSFSQNNLRNSLNTNTTTTNSFQSYLSTSSNSFVKKYQNSNLISNTASSSFSYAPANYKLRADYLIQTSDSTTTVKTKWYKTDTGASLLVAGTLIGLGTYSHFNDGFIDKVYVRDEINRYLPEFHYPLDDYIQYAPYVATFALDFAGIKSKHKTTRKLTTLGTAIALNLVVVQGLKYSIAEPRPDGSSNNSFPSGHTATAFMGAHIFHKEYRHKSPFYSIAGYMIATMTGVLRQLNNRHWISDVMAGAGIGIGVTELAYYLNGRWWDEKGINEYTPTTREINEMKPSFIGFKAGYASLVNSTDANEPGISSKSGFKISAEGAYFFTKNFGVGGEVGFQSFPNTIDSDVQQYFNGLGYEIIPQSSGNRMYYTGAYYQFPFGKNSVGTKILVGAISGPNTKIYIRELDPQLPEGEFPEEIVYAEYDPSTTLSWSTGAYYKRVLNKNLALSLYADYNIADTKYVVSYIESIDGNGDPVYSSNIQKTSNWNNYSIGMSVNVMLW